MKERSIFLQECKIFKSEFHLYLHILFVHFYLCSVLSHMYFFFFNLLQNLVIKISWCNITWSWHERILLDLSLSENDLHLTIMSLDRLLIVAKSIIIRHWYCIQLVKYFFLLFKFDIYFSLLNFFSSMINSSNSIFRSLSMSSFLKLFLQLLLEF